MVQALRIACQCASSDLCNVIPRTNPKQNTEAYVVTEGKSSHKEWVWDHISMVLNQGPDNTDLMCHAHSLGVGYAIMEEMPVFENYTDNQNYSDWVEKVGQRIKHMHADGVSVNLLDLIGQCNVDAEHVDKVTEAVGQVYRRIKSEGWPKLFCIVPWMPPCYQGQCHLTSELLNYCDYFVTNPDSYISTCNLQCRAQATIPKSRMVLGIDEYLAVGVKKSQLLMGIPWHGYDYKCDKVQITKDHSRVCLLPKNNETNECEFKASRRRLSISDIMANYPKQFSSHNWDGLQAAPYFDSNFLNRTVNESHSIWFEAMDSLLDKYQTVKQANLEGVMIFTGDDLTNSVTDAKNEIVWNWMIHVLFLTGSAVNHDQMDMAGKAAGIGVGCFLGGCLFGFLVTCIAYTKRVKKLKIRKPFEKDDYMGDEYHDEDNNL